MAEARQWLRILGYLVTLALHLSVMKTMYSGQRSTDQRVQTFRGNRARYLTGWNMFLQLFHAILGLCCEYLLIKNSDIRSYALPKYLRVARDKLFTNIVFPGSMLVATLFWTIFTYDRELVFPLFLDQIISNAFNHTIHTLIVPLALYEVSVQPRREPRSHLWNCLHIALHMIAYGCVLIYTYYEKGQYLYPILEKLELPYLCLFIGTVIGLVYFFYFLHWRIVRLVWGEKPVGKVGQRSRKIR